MAIKTPNLPNLIPSKIFHYVDTLDGIYSGIDSVHYTSTY